MSGDPWWEYKTWFTRDASLNARDASEHHAHVGLPLLLVRQDRARVLHHALDRPIRQPRHDVVDHAPRERVVGREMETVHRLSREFDEPLQRDQVLVEGERG